MTRGVVGAAIVFLLLFLSASTAATPSVSGWDISGNGTEIRLNQTPAGGATLRYERDAGWVKTDTITFTGATYATVFSTPLTSGAWNLTLQIPGNNSNESSTILSKLFTVAPVATPRPAAAVLAVSITGIYADSGLPTSANHEIVGTVSGGGNITMLRVGVNPGSVPTPCGSAPSLVALSPTRGFAWTWAVKDQLAKGVQLPLNKPWAIVALVEDDIGGSACASVFPVWLRSPGESVPEGSNATGNTTAKPAAKEQVRVLTDKCNFPQKKEEKGECKIVFSRAVEFFDCTADPGQVAGEAMKGRDCLPGVQNREGASRDLERLQGRQLCAWLKDEKALWNGNQVTTVCVDPGEERKRTPTAVVDGVGGVGGEALLKGCDPPQTLTVRDGQRSERVPNWRVGQSTVCSFREPVYLKVTIPGAGGGTGILYNTVAAVGVPLPRDLNVLKASPKDLETLLKRSSWQVNLSVPGTLSMEASTDGETWDTVMSRVEVLGEAGWGAGEWILLLGFLSYGLGYQLFFRQIVWRFMWRPRFRVRRREGTSDSMDYDVAGVSEIYNHKELAPGFHYGCWGGERGWMTVRLWGRSRHVRVVSISVEPVSEKNRSPRSLVNAQHGWVLRSWGHTQPMVVEVEERIPAEKYGEQDIRGDFEYHWSAPDARLLELLKVKCTERNLLDAAAKGTLLAQGAPAPGPAQDIALPPLDPKYAAVLPPQPSAERPGGGV